MNGYFPKGNIGPSPHLQHLDLVKTKKSKEKQIQRNLFSFSFMKIEFNEQSSEISLANLQDTSFNQKKQVKISKKIRQIVVCQKLWEKFVNNTLRSISNRSKDSN